MSNKKIINIVYAPGKDSPKKMFENKKGEIWNSNKYDPKKINIGMGWYSIKDPKPQDSILVVEPISILERDYSPNFAGKFKYIFTWASKAFTNEVFKNKIIEITHPTYHNSPNLDNIKSKWLPWDQRENKIIFVANNKSSQHYSELYSFRLILADILHEYSSFQVEWYGQIPIKKDYYKGDLDNKQQLLNKVKFSVCTENSYDSIYTHNYFTEKMPDVWQSGSIPIYFGCFNIDDFNLPKNSYIDLRNYCKKENGKWIIKKEELINKIETFSNENYNSYLKDLENDIFKSGKFDKLTSFEDTYKKIINKFSQE